VCTARRATIVDGPYAVINYPPALDDDDTLNYPLVTRTEKVRPINASVPLTRYGR